MTMIRRGRTFGLESADRDMTAAKTMMMMLYFCS